MSKANAISNSDAISNVIGSAGSQLGLINAVDSTNADLDSIAFFANNLQHRRFA